MSGETNKRFYTLHEPESDNESISTNDSHNDTGIHVSDGKDQDSDHESANSRDNNCISNKKQQSLHPHNCIKCHLTDIETKSEKE